MYRKYFFIIISLQQNYSSRDTIPLKGQTYECECCLREIVRDLAA
jgi:hypothetical protein